MAGYVRSHWRGEQSLARSFWLNNVLLSVLVAGLIGYLLPDDDLSIRSELAWIWVPTPILVGMAVWQLVGLWRSTSRSLAEKRGRVMPQLARAFIILDVVAAGAGMAADVVGSAQLVQALTDPDMTEHRLVIDEVAQAAIFYGALSDRSADRLVAALDEGRYTTLHITSQGGLLRPALHLARKIREHSVQVVVEDACASACVFLLAASPAGVISPEADVVLHQAQLVASRLPWLTLDAEERMNSHVFREFGVGAVVYGPLRDHEFWQPTLHQMTRGRLVDFIIDPTTRKQVPAADWCAGHAAECDAERWSPES